MAEYTEEFETFWLKYPKRWNRDLNAYVKRKKFPAFQKWQKLPKEIRAKCLRIVGQIRKAEGTPRDAITWLNQEGWDDIEDKWVPSLPAGATISMKGVPEVAVNTNNERNRQMALLRSVTDGKVQEKAF